MWDLAWLLIPVALLPVAAASGWFAAKRSYGNSQRKVAVQELRSDYFRGINYLLNEQPDKAIELFIRVLEVDSDTVETHLALGNLYRRRGETDRAIRIHQNLIARPTLTANQRNEALLELGHDYMSAGLLDRAESLFKELIDVDEHSPAALRQIIDLYEQEKDWQQAITHARTLAGESGENQDHMIAHYYCEIASANAERGDTQAALSALRQAFEADPNCVRASLFEGDLFVELGDTQSALASFKRVERQDPDFLAEVIARISKCYDDRQRDLEYAAYLRSVIERFDSEAAVLALSYLIERNDGVSASTDFVLDRLSKSPSIAGLERLLALEITQRNDETSTRLHAVRRLVGRLSDASAAYRCEHCGFSAGRLYWKCPACKHWNTHKPTELQT